MAEHAWPSLGLSDSPRAQQREDCRSPRDSGEQTPPAGYGATDPVSVSPEERVTKHEMNVSPWSHVAWSGA